jgi:ATP adenylyltransferase/5',5'''-P-1,P-4-tetraphosphate phosphorylase II
MGIGKKTHFKIKKMNTLQQEIEKLYSEQLTEWAQFKENASHLNNVKIHSYDFGNYVIKTQYNPARIVSSNAKLDEKSIAARKCFLCSENRPPVQREVWLNERFVALVNPNPILKEHFTIPFIQHKKQEILPYLEDMLDFAQMLPDYIIFYNGPKAGASAPDHIHFQAVRKGQLPLESEYQEIEKKVLIEDSDRKVSTLQDYGRHCTLIQSSGKEIVSSLFQQMYAQLQSLFDTGEEPMMNVFASYENGQWNLFVFPRKAHRPSQFFAEGEDYKMISPGAIDMAGVFVLPREEDFESISKEIILDVLRQVSLP